MSSSFNQEASTSLELIYSMRCFKQADTHPGNYPVIQETVLGWTIAGRTPANPTLEDVKRAFLQRETIKMEYIIKLLGSGTSGAIHHDSKAEGL
jgi:hypothetical protein